MQASLSKSTSTVTLTFGDQAENHAGMQKLGASAREGFTPEDLEEAKKCFENKKVSCEMYDLVSLLSAEQKKNMSSNAVLLVIRNGGTSFAQVKGGGR